VQSNPDPLSLIQAKEFDVASIPTTGTNQVVATNVPVPVERPDPFAARPAATQSARPAASQVVLASSMTNEWMLRFDAGNATTPARAPTPMPSPKRSPAGIDR